MSVKLPVILEKEVVQADGFEEGGVGSEYEGYFGVEMAPQLDKPYSFPNQ